MLEPNKKINIIGRVVAAIIIMIFFIPIFFAALDTPRVHAQYEGNYGIENEWTRERRSACETYARNAKKYTDLTNSNDLDPENYALKALVNLEAFQVFCKKNVAIQQYHQTPQEKSPFDY